MSAAELEATMQRLSDIEAIKRLKYKYWRCVDNQRWADLRTCYADDAEASYMSGQWTFSGGDPIVDFLASSLTEIRKGMEERGEGSSGHLGLQPEVELTSPTTARARWVASSGDGALYYEDEYVKVDGDWKIKRSDNYSGLAARM